MPYTQRKGLDASHWEGNPDVDMHKAKLSGIQFWFEKATEGLSTDPTFKSRQSRVRSVFGVRGWYHFCHSSVDAVKQGEFFSTTIGQLKPHEYAAFDVEQGWGDLTGLDGINYLLKIINAFKEKSGATDDQIIIYGSNGWLKGQFGEHLSLLTPFHLWAARYANDLGDISPWSAALIWQNNEKGTVPGVGTGSVDIDYWLDGHWPV